MKTTWGMRSMWYSHRRRIKDVYNLMRKWCPLYLIYWLIGSYLRQTFINHNFITVLIYSVFISAFLPVSLTLSITALMYFSSVLFGFQPRCFQASCSHEETPADSVSLWRYTPVCINHFQTLINSNLSNHQPPKLNHISINLCTDMKSSVPLRQ